MKTNHYAKEPQRVLNSCNKKRWCYSIVKDVYLHNIAVRRCPWFGASYLRCI